MLCRVIRSISHYPSVNLILGWRPHQFMFLIALQLGWLWIPSLRYPHKTMLLHTCKKKIQMYWYWLSFLDSKFVTGLVIDKLHEWSASNSSVPQRDCILLAACEAHETLPQSAEFPADVFTSCLTTPIKMALRWWNFSLILSLSCSECLVC